MTHDSGSRRRGFSWARLWLTLAICGPALAIGGVPPAVVPVFVAVVGAAWVRLCVRRPDAIELPLATLIGALAVTLTALQLLPMPAVVRALVAPGIEAEVSNALAGTGAAAWPTITPTPADTGLEVSRLVGLTFLVAVSAQLSWRVTATAVAGLGLLVTLVGFVHELVGVDAIYGLYEAQYTGLTTAGRGMLGTFVNGNHQAGLLLLSIFSTGALAVDQGTRAIDSRDLTRARRHADLAYAAVGALVIQSFGLLFTLSRGGLLALIIVGPAALVWWVRGRARHRRAEGRRRLRPRAAARLALAAVLAGLVIIVARHTVTPELDSLMSLTEQGLSTETKYRAVLDAFGLVALSPVLGVGRGAHIDLFPLVQGDPTNLLFTHLESVPVTMLIEWGPVGGGAIALALVAWWIRAVAKRGSRPDAIARGIALLGLLALAIQSLADFGLEFLGVAAPACALAGALSPTRPIRWATRPAFRVGVPVLAVAGAIAIPCVPGTWSRRPERNRELVAGELAADRALRVRPLDGRLHVVLARAAAQRGDWAEARARAAIATRLAPGVTDGWLILAAAERAAGEHAAAAAHMREGLSRLRSAPSPELVDYVLAVYPRAADLAAAAPTTEPAWSILAAALRKEAPAHADAVAAARQDVAPDDPAPLRMRHRHAMRAELPGLALHHARLLRAVAPQEAGSHLAVARALNAHDPPRRDEAIDALAEGIESGAVRRAGERGRLEEELAAALLRRSVPGDLDRVRDLMPTLLARPAGERARKRRNHLQSRLEAAIEAQR